MKTVLDVLHDELEDVLGSYKEFVALGHAKDYAEYRELCGVIRGLRSAQIEVQDLASRTKEDEDE